MNAEPPDLDRAALLSTLRTWELSVTSLMYLPVGAGSHHHLAHDSDGRRWFVTVDELVSKLFGMLGPTFSPWLDIDLEAAFNALDRAFRTAVALREAGLDFVHAPITRPDGGVLTRLGDYAVSVFPFIDGISDTHGGVGRQRLLETLGRLHATTDAVPPGLPQRDTLAVPLRLRFFESLDDLRSPWTNGPYGEPARLLLRDRAGAVRDLFDRCDELADAVRATNKPWVVTHGQMHAANIIRTKDDVLLLVDWDCVAVAPRERDLGTWGNDLDPKTDEDWAAYTSAGASPDIDPTAVGLYRHIGSLWGVCAYTEVFRSPHVDDADTRQMWTNFQTNLAEAESLGRSAALGL
jgi:spectinomycin phosphotransferase